MRVHVEYRNGRKEWLAGELMPDGAYEVTLPEGATVLGWHSQSFGRAVHKTMLAGGVLRIATDDALTA